MSDQPNPIDYAARVTALEQELTATRIQANTRLMKSELKAEAIRAGMIDLDCLKLLESSDLKLTDDGAVPDAAAVLANLKRDKPWMFAKANSSHPASTPTPEPPKAKTAMDMTHNEWRAAREKLIRRR
jgi:hypothetical protein